MAGEIDPSVPVFRHLVLLGKWAEVPGKSRQDLKREVDPS